MAEIPPATPAAIVGQLLKDFYQIEEAGAWPYYVSIQPDEPEECLTLYDTSPILQGSLVSSGYTRLRYGVQLRARGRNYSLTWCKLEAIREWFDKVCQVTVRIQERNYLIWNISCTSGVVSIGRTEDKLSEFTLNIVLTI